MASRSTRPGRARDADERAGGEHTHSRPGRSDDDRLIEHQTRHRAVRRADRFECRELVQLLHGAREHRLRRDDEADDEAEQRGDEDRAAGAPSA